MLLHAVCMACWQQVMLLVAPGNARRIPDVFCVQQQGPLPHPQPQTKPDSHEAGAEGRAGPGTTDAKKEKPWWETAADSAVGAFEAAKSAVVGGVESLTKGDPDKGTGESQADTMLSESARVLTVVARSAWLGVWSGLPVTEPASCHQQC